MKTAIAEDLVARLRSMDGFFHRLTGKRVHELLGGSHAVDAAVNEALEKKNSALLQYEYPYRTLVEEQGNIFGYEDFGPDEISRQLEKANSRIINSKFAGAAGNVDR